MQFRDHFAENRVDRLVFAVSHEHPEPKLPALRRTLGDGIELFQDPQGEWLRAVDAYHAGGHPMTRGGVAIPHLAWVDGDGTVMWSWRAPNYRRRLEPEDALVAGLACGAIDE